MVDNSDMSKIKKSAKCKITVIFLRSFKKYDIFCNMAKLKKACFYRKRGYLRLRNIAEIFHGYNVKVYSLTI